MSSAKKLQTKLFSSQASSAAPGSSTPQPSQQPAAAAAAEPASVLSPSSSVRPGLSIEVPRPGPSESPVLPTKVATKPTQTTPPLGDEQQEPQDQYRTYRERLIDQLGAEYEGVERHRLIQDGKRERHWKRWGPYLSERQWVRRVASLHPSILA